MFHIDLEFIVTKDQHSVTIVDPCYMASLSKACNVKVRTTNTILKSVYNIEQSNEGLMS